MSLTKDAAVHLFHLAIDVVDEGGCFGGRRSWRQLGGLQACGLHLIVHLPRHVHIPVALKACMDMRQDNQEVFLILRDFDIQPSLTSTFLQTFMSK